MKSLYLLVNLGAIIIPLVFSFHPKLRFYQLWRYAWPAIILTAIPFIIWDSLFTSLEVWSFNKDYMLGLELFGLPLEEILFFIAIPYACLFTYFCLSLRIEAKRNRTITTWFTAILVLFLLVVAFTNLGRLYTSVTFLLLAGFLLFLQFVYRAPWLGRFYLAYLILLIPFFIVNGILTGTGPDSAVVSYNQQFNLGLRILTIPIEDVFYGMLLILMNVGIYEFLKSSGFYQEKNSRIPV